MMCRNGSDLVCTALTWRWKITALIVLISAFLGGLGPWKEEKGEFAVQFQFCNDRLCDCRGKKDICTAESSSETGRRYS